MGQRLTFLLGNLCGLVVGGLLVWAYYADRPVAGEAAPAIRPLQGYVVPVKLNSADTPPGWQRREFNGRPFYIIPIAAPHLD